MFEPGPARGLPAVFRPCRGVVLGPRAQPRSFQRSFEPRGRYPAVAQGTLGRGCSAYEETLAEDPYGITQACKAAAFTDNMPRLRLSKYKSKMQRFYNHAFALLEVSPLQITAKYYEYPSWDQEYTPPDPPIEAPVFTEVLSPIERAPVVS